MSATQPSAVSDDPALAEFTEYFVKNYPGPQTIICDPNWHAPRIFRAAKRAITAAAPTPPAAAELDAVRLQNESLRGVIHDEIAANTAFREAAGALPDEDMPTFCARIIRELDAARRDAWLPIESAPRDGKQGRMLLAWADGTVEQGLFVNNETWQGFRPESLRPWPDGQPTHWRPLPAPPDAAMAREGQ